MSPVGTRPPLRGLTGLRALAAAHVVLFHTIGDSGVALPPVGRHVIAHGDMAVSLFFVLSGFVLTYSYADTTLRVIRGGWRAFLWARLARIYPLYVVGWMFDLPRGVELFSRLGWVKGCVSASLYLVGLQAWHPRTATSWNAPGWSISAEFFFYAAFPLILWGFARWGIVRRVVAVLLLAVASALLGLLVREHVAAEDSAWAHSFQHFWPGNRVWEFALGVVVGGAYVNGYRMPRFAALVAVVSSLGFVATSRYVDHVVLSCALRSSPFSFRRWPAARYGGSSTGGSACGARQVSRSTSFTCRFATSGSGFFRSIVMASATSRTGRCC